MFAVAAFVAFAIAFILHLLSSAPARDVTDFVIAGLALVAAHLAWPLIPWGRRP